MKEIVVNQKDDMKIVNELYFYLPIFWMLGKSWYLTTGHFSLLVPLLDKYIPVQKDGAKSTFWHSEIGRQNIFWSMSKQIRNG